jgi:hypothetical protein
MMAIRLARGLFRLWFVFSLVWIAVVGLLTWRDFLQLPSSLPEGSEAAAAVEICSEAKSDTQCADLLKAAGKNPFGAFFLEWKEGNLISAHGNRIGPASIQWNQVPLVLSLSPPIVVLLVGSMLVWAFKGFSAA